MSEPARLSPTTAMVLAAGLGNRMRPITATLPKPLVEVGGRTMLDRALDRLAEAGIERAVVNVHHLASLVERHLRERTRPQITVSDERDALLETGGGVKRALPLLGAGPFLVLNSDSLWVERGPSNIARLIAAWEPETTDILLLVAPTATSLGYEGRGDFRLAEDGTLARRPAGGTAPLVFAGVSILTSDLFADTPDGAFSLNVLFDRAIARGRLRGVVLDGEWLHVGTPEAIAPATRRLAEAGR